MKVNKKGLILMMVLCLFGCIKRVHNKSIYFVKPGDNLSSIAYEHYKNRIYWRFIAFWNDIPSNKSNDIEIGDTLILINLGLSPVLHRVVKGEGLFTVARNNSVDYSDLKAWNDRSTDRITEGQLLIVGWSHPLIAFFF